EDPPAPGERCFATLADLAAATHAVERAAAALELIAGLGVRPAQLSPESLAAMAKAASRKGATVVIDPAAIDTGTLARTVLVARLLGGPPAPLAALAAKAIRKFKHNFNSGLQLPESASLQAASILGESLGGAPLGGPHRKVALRWIASLHPLGSVLGADLPGTP
ncbi:MAG TPA: hypothetical protein VF524_01710, partial [Polyangia bacterium]